MSYKSKTFRVICSLLILFVGTTLASVLSGTTGLIGAFGQSLGLALVVTGCISVFREGVISPAEFEETKELVDEVKTVIGNDFDDIRQVLVKPRIYLLSEERQGHPSYHKWLLETKQQHIFFAGHSVLHRVKEDFESMGFKSVEENIEHKLSEGSHINILFLDPTWELLKDMAEGEGRSIKDFCFDIKTTLEVCHGIWKRIEGGKFPGDINIYTCRETVQYAYHYVFCSDNKESEMLIGFYFAGKPGSSSPIFRVEGENIQQFFQKHFKKILEGRETTVRLLTYSHKGKECKFDLPYYERCIDRLNNDLKALE